jgi:putative ABC transport system permease protein
MLARLALRNLARNRRRSALALLVIASGGAALLLTAGFIRYSFNGLGEAVIKGGLGHLEVAPASAVATGGGPDRAAPPSVERWEPMRASIEAAPHVVGATGAIVLTGLVSRDERSVPFVGAGLETDREQRMGLEVRLRAGERLRSEAPPAGEEEALLGLGLAGQLGARTGDVVTLTVVTVDGTLNALDVRVAGLVTTGVQDLDVRFLRTHLATAQRVLGTTAVSSVVVMLDETARTAEMKGEITRLVAGRSPRLEVTDWQTRAPFYGQVRSLYAGIFGFLGSVVLVLVLLSSSNTLLMAVMERVREIGALLAIGTSPGQVLRMILLEGLWLGFIGGVAGGLLGASLGLLLRALHIKMPPPPGAVEGVDLGVALLPWDVAWVTGLMVVVLGLAAVLPALRMLRLRIAEALVHQ